MEGSSSSSSRICKRKQPEGTAANPINLDDDNHEVVDLTLTVQPSMLFHPTLGYSYDFLVNSISEAASINEIFAQDSDVITIENIPSLIESMGFIESTAPQLLPRLHHAVNSYKQGKLNLGLVTGTIEVLRARAAVLQSVNMKESKNALDETEGKTNKVMTASHSKGKEAMQIHKGGKTSKYKKQAYELKHGIEVECKNDAEEEIDVEEESNDEESNEGDDENVERQEKMQEDKNVEDEEEVVGQHAILPFYDIVNHHVSGQLLRNPPMDRGALECRQCTSKMERWRIEDEDEPIRNFVTSSVLYKLTKCSYENANKVIISAFVERWHPETNTFHMPFGEMTITLDDVHELLGLPIIGKSMGDIPKQDGLLRDWISTLLGIPSRMVQAELSFNNCNMLRTQWLIDHLSKTGKFQTQATHEQVARGYLLMVLGCTLFQDRSGDKVQPKYLHYLVDIHKEKVNAWAWGAGCLAYLYRMLGKASTASAKAASGYLTLIEAWVYEHFEKYRPCDPIQLKEGMQRTKKWNPKAQRVHEGNDKLKYIRAKLDQTTKDSVIWSPYRIIEEDPSEVVWFHGCLIIDKTQEPYHPERVARQFGRVQDTPNPPIRALYASRKQTKGYKARFESSGSDFDNYIYHLVPAASRGARATFNGECTVGYDTWYKSVAICRLTTEDAAAMREVDNKAVDLLESFENTGIKKTKKELEDGIRSVIDVLKKKMCDRGAVELEVGESSKMASERGKHKKVEKSSTNDESTKGKGKCTK